MTYQHERDEFISKATREGLDLRTIHKLLRYSTTLHRLQEAQCNGDYPYNGDRDRPDRMQTHGREWWDKRYTVCPKCEASGVAKSAMRRSSASHLPDCPDFGKTSVQCARCQPSICPDCRTQELVRALLASVDTGCTCGNEDRINPIFQGDPRGATLLLSTPNYPWTEDGRGRGLYVPARAR